MQPQKPSPKNFLIMFVRIFVLCALAYAIVSGVRFLVNMF